MGTKLRSQLIAARDNFCALSVDCFSFPFFFGTRRDDGSLEKRDAFAIILRGYAVDDGLFNFCGAVASVTWWLWHLCIAWPCPISILLLTRHPHRNTVAGSENTVLQLPTRPVQICEDFKMEAQLGQRLIYSRGAANDSTSGLPQPGPNPY